MTSRTVRLRSFAFLAAACLAVGCARVPCREITAREFRVLRIVDGDTFKVRYDGDVTSVRLYGVDAPERSDPNGPAATEALREMIDRKTVRLVFPATSKRDNFGRLLARVFVHGTDVGRELLRRGLAEPYRLTWEQ